jgi:hypothetical protein
LRAPPLPTRGGAFSHGDYRFQIEDYEFGIYGLKHSLDEECLDDILLQSNKMPPLDGSPVSSWMLARLAKLTLGSLGFPLKSRQRNDGGGFALDFITYVGSAPVAVFQLQGDTMGAAVLGRRTENYASDVILKCLVSALLESPEEVSMCSLSVTDPEWKEDPDSYTPKPVRGSRNWYGWNGKRYLGENNIRSA